MSILLYRLEIILTVAEFRARLVNGAICILLRDQLAATGGVPFVP